MGMVSILTPVTSTAASPTSSTTSKRKVVSPKALKTAKKANSKDVSDSPGVGEEALEQVRSDLRAKGLTVLEEPKGKPMFQFFLAKGKTKPVMTFMDSGCSDAIFKEGIPAVQWTDLLVSCCRACRSF